MSSTQSYTVTGSPSPRRSTYRRIGGASGHGKKPSAPSSAVPFSWERRPGIPKSPCGLTPCPPGSLLPLPPPVRSSADESGGSGGKRKKRPACRGGGAASDDPFAAAAAECAKEPLPPDLDELFPRSAAVAGRRRAAAAWSVSRRLGIFGLHGSCKATCAVFDSTVRVVGSRIRTGGGFLNHRSS